MKIICRARQAGKTTKLVKLSAKTGKYIVCLDENRKKNILQIAEKWKLNIPYPITLMEITRWQSYRGSSVMRDWIYIDDWLDILQAMFPLPIDTISISK